MKHLMCNLKTNSTFSEMQTYLEEINKIENKENLFIFPTNLYLTMLSNYDLTFGAQDISRYTDSSNTGEILASQVSSLGATYTILGHSERRRKFNENEIILLDKVRNALDANLKVVYCIGETLEEKELNQTYQVLESQIAKVFNSLNKEEIEKIIIAYEPVWAIGSGTPAQPEEIEELTTFIKKIVLDYYDYEIEVLYGGSVKSDNIVLFKTVDGFLVGKASLNPEEVEKMLHIINS